MEERSQKPYFDKQSLQRFVASEGKTIKGIICYLWQNNINKNDVIELIDNVELVFTDDSKLTFGCNNDNSGLEAIEFDFKAEKAELEKEFEGRIKLFGVNASPTNMWKDVVGTKLISVQLTKEDGNYLSDSVLLDFGTEKRTIAVSPMDGLIIDFYEE